MTSHTNLGRLLGISMLVTFIVGIVSNFKLQNDLFDGGGLLVNAASHPLKIGLICVLGMGSSLFSLWVATRLARSYRAASGDSLRFYVAILTAGLALTLLEFATLVGFREVSEFYLAAAEPKKVLIESASRLLAGLRNGIHFMDKILGGFSVAVLFGILFRTRLLPRWLAVLGMLGASLQMLAVGRAVFGGEVDFPLLIPLSVVFIVAMGYLLIVGFREPPITARDPDLD